MGALVHARDTRERPMRADRFFMRPESWLVYLAAGVLAMERAASGRAPAQTRRGLSFRKAAVRRPAFGPEPG